MRTCLVPLLVLCLLAGCGTEPTSIAVPTETSDDVGTEVARIRATAIAATATAAAAQTATALAVTQTPTDTATPTATATETPSPTATFTPTPLPPSTLQGQVLDEDSGQPVTGAQVTARGWFTTTTDSDGRFVFSDLPLGQYTVLVTATDHDPALSGIVQVSAGEQTVVDATLPAAGAGEYPEDPMATNQIDPAGAPTAKDAERLARQQGFTGEVTSTQPVTLTGAYLVNYRKGDTIRSALATLHHPAWELVDEAGRAWYIVRVCGNLAVVRPPQVEVPAQCVATPHPVVTVGDAAIVGYACPSEGCELVAELPAGWHGIALACSSGCTWLLVQQPARNSECWIPAIAITVHGNLARLPERGLSRIAYVGADGNIWTVNPDGSEQRQLTETGDCHKPSWSWSGDRIAFIRGQVGPPDMGYHGELWIMDSDGTHKAKVTTDVMVAVGGPSWSPDDTMLAFSRSEILPTIYLLDLSDRSQTRLALGMDPAWSPDGAKIAFWWAVNEETLQPQTKQTPTSSPTERAYYRYQIFLVDVQTGEETILSSLTGDTRPAWSADGRQLAFSSFCSSSNDSCMRQGGIFASSSDGTNRMQLTYWEDAAISVWSLAPTWSPDGKEIAYVEGFYSDDPAIHVMSSGGKTSRRLVPGTDPAWQPKR
jgi:hypothetical protein